MLRKTLALLDLFATSTLAARDAADALKATLPHIPKTSSHTSQPRRLRLYCGASKPTAKEKRARRSQKEQARHRRNRSRTRT